MAFTGICFPCTTRGNYNCDFAQNQPCTDCSYLARQRNRVPNCHATRVTIAEHMARVNQNNLRNLQVHRQNQANLRNQRQQSNRQHRGNHKVGTFDFAPGNHPVNHGHDMQQFTANTGGNRPHARTAQALPLSGNLATVRDGMKRRNRQGQPDRSGGARLQQEISDLSRRVEDTNRKNEHGKRRREVDLERELEEERNTRVSIEARQEEADRRQQEADRVIADLRRQVEQPRFERGQGVPNQGRPWDRPFVAQPHFNRKGGGMYPGGLGQRNQEVNHDGQERMHPDDLNLQLNRQARIQPDELDEQLNRGGYRNQAESIHPNALEDRNQALAFRARQPEGMEVDERVDPNQLHQSLQRANQAEPERMDQNQLQQYMQGVNRNATERVDPNQLHQSLQRANQGGPERVNPNQLQQTLQIADPNAPERMDPTQLQQSLRVPEPNAPERMDPNQLQQTLRVPDPNTQERMNPNQLQQSLRVPDPNAQEGMDPDLLQQSIHNARPRETPAEQRRREDQVDGAWAVNMMPIVMSQPEEGRREHIFNMATSQGQRCALLQACGLSLRP